MPHYPLGEGLVETIEKKSEFTLWIDPYSPTTIPMARLAEYMSDFATLLGERASVHFARLDEGSTKLVSCVEHEAAPKVRALVDLAKRVYGTPEGRRASTRIRSELREVRGSGGMVDEEAAEIIAFPGRNQPEDPRFEHVAQGGCLVGTVIRVGGTKEIVSVHLQADSGVTYTCTAPRSLAKEIANYLFTGTVRVFGHGRWTRTELGSWEQEGFRIDRFDALDNEPLSSVLADLRAIQGSQWPEMDDPWDRLDQLRNGNGGTH